MKIISVLFFLVITHTSVSQNSFFQRSDSINLTRVIPVGTSLGIAWTGGVIGMSKIWYADYPKSKFHTFNDFHNWLQMDKFGHAFTANKLSLFASDLFFWSGLKKRNSVIIGSAIGLGLQTSLEFMDGTSAEWGFSWGDMVFNMLGSSTYAFQELVWNEQRFIYKFSYHPTEYASVRPEILGSTFSERFLKDYNGQTYWLSFSPSSFFKSSKIPSWVCLSFGYSVDQKLVGDKEIYYSTINNTTYFSKREFIFSLDVDFSNLPIKRLWLKSIVKQFNCIKIPFPSLVFSNNTIRGVGFYF